MLHKFFVSLLIVFGFSISFGQGLQVNTTTYSFEELVTDVLINDPCNESIVSGIQVYGGHLFGTPSIAYFTNTNPDFPIESGVLLSTGHVNNAPGPNNSNQGAGSQAWLGDEQLRQYMMDWDPELQSTHNASIITFDFVPSSNFISFNFMFVSEEYGTFQCSYSDAFAFFLTNNDTGEVQNLAIVPGTEDPISVITIRDNTYNSGCSSVNPEYFGNFFPQNNNTAAHNFNGETVLLTAMSDVVPNTSYNIKLVIADRNDTSYDSAVLLEAGSFSLTSANLGEDLTIETGTALCEEQTHTLVVDYQENYIYSWFLDGDLIEGENTNILEVAQPGSYVVEVQLLPGDCVISDEIVIEAFDFSGIAPQDLFECEGLEQNAFDLTVNIYPAFENSFFTSFEDAQNNQNAIPAEEWDDYAGSNGEVIWLRLQQADSECAVFRSFNLNTITLDIPDETPVYEFCAPHPSTAHIETDLTQYIDEVVPNSNQFTFEYYSSQQDALDEVNAIQNPQNYSWNETQSIWLVYTSNESGCSGLAEFILQRNEGPENVELPLQVYCQSVLGEPQTLIDLQSITEQFSQASPGVIVQYYNSEADAIAQQNILSAILVDGHNTQTYFASLGHATNECTTIVNFDIIVNPLPVVPEAVEYEVCNVDTAGFAEFDLEYLENHFDTNDNYQISFHATANDAENGENQLQSPFTNTVPFEQIIFVRIENPDTACYLIIEQTLLVTESLEIVGPFFPEVCTEPGENAFSLTLNYLNTLYSASTFIGTITYHLSEEDAYSGTNSFTNPQTIGAGNSLQVYIRFTDPSGNCYDVIEETFTVLESPLMPEPIVTAFCDVDGTGIYTFDLQSLSQQYLANYVNTSITFYASEQDALNNSNPLPSNYTNVTPFEQLIYFRITDQNTGCVILGTHLLEVFPNADLVDSLEISLCDDNFDEQYQIDLTQYYSDLMQSGNIANYDITVYPTFSDAENQNNAIAQPNNIQVNILPQSYFVRYDVSGQPCFNITRIDFVPNPQVQYNSNIADIQLCETANSQAPIQFSNYFGQISNHANAQFSFHATEQAAMQNQSPFSEQMMTSTSTYWVRIEAEGYCPAIASFDVIVNPMPLASIEPETTIACDNEIIRIHNTINYTESFEFYWSDDMGNVFNQNADGSIEYSGPAGLRTVSLTVTHPISGCSTTVSVDVQILQTPEVTSVEVDGSNAVVFAIPNAGNQYSLDGINWQYSPRFQNLATGIHDIYVRAANSDCISEPFQFLILNINNVITPNQDGLNDLFIIPHLDVFRGESGEILSSTLHIYNRQGKLLYEDHSRQGVNQLTWDGTYGGRPVNTGTYWYILRLADGRQFQGHITVKRR